MEATHVLVLGHSLHDPPLVRAIEEFASRVRVAVTHHRPREDPQERDREDMREEQPETGQGSLRLIQVARQIRADFGPDPFFDREFSLTESFENWLAP